jgi:hypothetical protein
LTARNLSIEHVQEAGEENHDCGDFEKSGGEHCGGPEIYNQSDEGKHVRINSGGRERAHDFIEQPSAACSDQTGDHYFFVVTNILLARSHNWRGKKKSSESYATGAAVSSEGRWAEK